MKKLIAICLIITLISMSTALPVYACYVSGSAPGCQVPTYTHNVNIGPGETNETFHPDTDINTRKQMYLNLTKITALYVFDASTTSGIVYNNYLWGEYDTGIGTHEGVDMRKSNGIDIRASLNGVVIAIGDTLGRISIYNSSYNVTISYMHMTGITKAVGETVDLGEVIGKQGSVGAGNRSHLHIQVEQGYKTWVNGGGDNNLESKIPYGYMSVETIQPAS